MAKTSNSQSSVVMLSYLLIYFGFSRVLLLACVIYCSQFVEIRGFQLTVYQKTETK